ncbi:MAG: OmpA family protein [Polyangiaceae bacterium]|nr:OmpA family protein [Polyangiaceae bacterium]
MTKLTLTVSVAALLLSACSAKIEAKTPEAAPAEEPAAEPAPEPAAEEPAPEPAAEPEAKAEDPSDVHIDGDHLTIDKMIHFAPNSDEILGDSTEILDHVATALKNHTELAVVHVIGHTDAVGSDEENQDLSERRAAAVVKALEERGVTQKIDATGKGETEHTCEEDTDECHEKNRRVEFVVLKSEEN